MTTHVVWDWNGTLLDDVQYAADLMDGLLEKRGMPPLGGLDAYYRAFTFPIRKYYANVGFENDDDFAAASVEWMDAYMAGESACWLRDTAVEALEYLKRENVRQVVVSASEIGNLTKQVERLNVKGYFDTLCGLRHIYATSKTDIARTWLLESGERAKDTVFIGDTTHDFQVASALGCRCVLLSGGHQARAALEGLGCEIAATPFEAARMALGRGRDEDDACDL